MVPQTIDRARKRFADIEFQCGNLFHVPLPLEHFDVLVSLEVLAHVADQSEFVDRVGSLLKPNGLLLLSTQNRYVYSRWSTIAPPASGQLRHWVNATELRNLLRPRFRLLSVRSFSPDGDLGLLRFTESQKLNRIASALIGTERVQSIKERLMLGGTLFATAIRV
jgi:SAM-dependent methyltransferase